MRTQRQLAVERHLDYRPRLNPRRTHGAQIRLKGAWLEQAGFEPGTTVTVISTAPGVLEIRTAKGGEA